MTSRVKELHSIMPIANMGSVLKHGILSHNKCKEVPHNDISLENVQDKRDSKVVPNGLPLHDYANLYFCARNPMMYRRKSEAQDLCVLKISLKVTHLSDVVYTDQNAARNYVKFFSKSEVKKSINFDWVFADDWNDDNQAMKWRKSSAKCAEVLIPH